MWPKLLSNPLPNPLPKPLLKLLPKRLPKLCCSRRWPSPYSEVASVKSAGQKSAIVKST
jgi:hypothetical protein